MKLVWQTSSQEVHRSELQVSISFTNPHSPSLQICDIYILLCTICPSWYVSISPLLPFSCLSTDLLALQTSIGTGYDLNNSIFSPDGQNFQVNYAVKAVENGGTSIGIRCMDGVVLAVEKTISSKLLKPGANKRIATVDTHVGAVSPCLLMHHGLLASLL